MRLFYDRFFLLSARPRGLYYDISFAFFYVSLLHTLFGFLICAQSISASRTIFRGTLGQSLCRPGLEMTRVGKGDRRRCLADDFCERRRLLLLDDALFVSSVAT